MTEEGGEQGQAALGILAGLIPLQEGICRESMPLMPISALAAACRLLDYAESGEVAHPSSPFGATFRIFLTSRTRHNPTIFPLLV
jgi:hypothetical protein